ncbi:MAG: hypothetical protein KBT48_03920 [Firmicutes bacterium]|nr:hypothetical protein [Bacillota bacterium]
MNNLDQGFLQEIEYQKRMLNNIKKYLKISIVLSACSVLGLVLAENMPLKILSIILFVISIFLVLILGWVIHNGYKNVNKVIDVYELKKKQA